MHEFLGCAGNQRQREIAVGDGGAGVQLACGAFGVHVDPLVVLGGFRKAVDALLIHQDPVGHPQFSALERLCVLDRSDLVSQVISRSVPVS